MPTRNAVLSGLKRLSILFIVPFFTSCAGMSPFYDIGRPWEKGEALKKPKNLLTYNRMGRLSQHLNVKDWDAKDTEFHYIWSPAASADTTLVFVHGYPASLFTWTGIIAPTTPTDFPAATTLASPKTSE